MWLVLVLNSLWHSTTLNDFNIEIHVGVQWYWLAANWGPGEGTTVGVVCWAVEMSFVTLMELRDRKIPTVEYLIVTKSENLWSSISLSLGVGDNSAILKSTYPMSSDPVALLTELIRSFFSDIDSDSCLIVVGSIMLIVLSIWTIYIWSNSCLLLNSGGSRSDGNNLSNLVHFYKILQI